MSECPCDEFDLPGLFNPPAGLSRLERHVDGFPEVRRALFAALRAQTVAGTQPLDAWRA